VPLAGWNIGAGPATVQQIVEARKAGQLHTLLSTSDDPPDPTPTSAHPDGVITVADLKTMTPEEIVAARRAGRMNHLLGVATRVNTSGADQGARGSY
jgi:hypothetical protein